jgi:hypothetical protein
MNNKKLIIEESNKFLKSYGFTQQDYIVSLQGPTIILSISGTQKMNEKLKEELLNIGMIIL